MNAGTFDGLLRRAAEAIDRRRSLIVLGVGALGLAATRAPDAGASDAARKGKQRCRRQRGPCLAFVQRRCEVSEARANAPDVGAAPLNPECIADFSPCCEFFAKCQAKLGLECLAPRRVVEPQ